MKSFNHKGHKGISQRDTKEERTAFLSFVLFVRTLCSSWLKKILKINLYCLFTLISPLIFEFSVFSQEAKLSEEILNIAEELAADESNPEIAEIYIEQLHELIENPVMINSGDEAEISRLFFLSDFQVKAIKDYVQTSGKIVSFYEIAGIPGFDRQTTEMMIPFISFSDKIISVSDTLIFRNTLLTNLTIKPGETDSSSLGSPWKILSKYRFNTGRFEGGFTIEKDQGEKFISGSSSLPDFLSAHLSYSGKGIIREIIVGDFSSRFGLGTNINTGIRTGLSLTSPGYMPGRDEIRPYTSADENNFFRGAAAEFSLKKLRLILFYSHKRIDATIRASADSSAFFVESLYKTGLHNTLSLNDKKDAVAEASYGINLSFNFKSLKVGLCWSENRFLLPVKTDKSNAEDLYKFEGSRNQIYSLYYNSLFNRILLFGELSLNDPQNLALVQGITLRPSDRLILNILYRNYTPGFVSFHGNGPGNTSSISNEQGISGSFIFEAAKHLFISAGCDISNSPWLKYRCSSPSLAKKEEIRIKYLPYENLSFDLSYNYRYSMLDNPLENGIAGIEEVKTRTIKGQARFTLNNVTFAFRADYKVVDPSDGKGMLLLHDIFYRFRQVPVTIWFRYCIFNTDNWDSRLYTYENDLLYSFSIPALSGEGSRSYIMAKWEIGDIAELRFKYGLTSDLSSANENEEKDEIKIQFRIWF